jgi:hypothetical protein
MSAVSKNTPQIGQICDGRQGSCWGITDRVEKNRRFYSRASTQYSFSLLPFKASISYSTRSLPTISFVDLSEGKRSGTQQSGEDQNRHSPQDHQSCSLIGSSTL